MMGTTTGREVTTITTTRIRRRRGLSIKEEMTWHSFEMKSVPSKG